MFCTGKETEQLAEVEEHLKEVCGGETLRPYQVWPVHFFTVQQVPVRFLSVEVIKKLRLSADTYFKVLENYYNFTPLLFYYKLIKINTESAASLFSIIYTGIDSIPNF